MWRDHDGGDCPVGAKSETIIVRFRNRRESGPAPASHWRWVSWPDGESPFDIIAWRLP